MNRTVVAGAIAAASLLTAGVASATNFDFSFSDGTSDTQDFPSGQTSASGVITAMAENDGSYLIQSITGSWNGENITGISAVGTEAGDNLVFPSQSTKLDGDGFTFAVSGPIKGDQGDGTVNIYYYDGYGYTDNGPATYLNGTFSLTQVAAVSAAPEPASWALMLGGVGFMGAMLRSISVRRREGDTRKAAV